MDLQKIEKVKVGDFFKMKESSKIVWIKDQYNRSFKRYEAHKFDDVNEFRLLKKGTEVYTNFEF